MRMIKLVGVLLALTTFACGGDDDPKKAVEVKCQGNVDCPDGTCNLSTGQCVPDTNTNNGTNNGTTNPNNGTTSPNNGTTNSNNGTTNQNNGTTNQNLCGNNIINNAELCDGDCPSECNDMDVCTTDTLSGAAETCDAQCSNVAITQCVDGDGCCAPGCTADNDLDCDLCGNGVLDANEACDKAIADGMPGACPTSCNDNDACTGDTMVGNSDQCSAMCSNTPTTSCVGGDGCCPSNCNANNDSDCGTIFGAACADDTDCGTNNFCLPEATTGNPGGFCSTGCTSDVDCGTDAFCSGTVCLPTCATNADCRTGYACNDFYGTGNTCVRDTNLATPGAGCAADTDCQGSLFSAVCFEEATSPNFEGGMCTLLCLNGDDGSCQGDASCTNVGEDDNGDDQFICAQSCTQTSDCRSGYVCTDFDADGSDECWPGATGTGVPGATCDSVQDCAGGADGLCATGTDFIDGYCTTDCTLTGCATGSVCTALSATASFCLDVCDPNIANECRTGYSCVDMDGNNTNECFPVASGSGGIGSSCSAVQDCAGGTDGFCIQNGFQDGYCSIDCTDDANLCGTDNCSSTGTSSICLDDCAVDADCRAGYSCQTFDGTTSCIPI